MEVTQQLPQWFIYLAGLCFMAVLSGFIKLIWERHKRIESRVDGLEVKTDLHITEDRHQRDLERIADSHERALEKIAEKHDKELNGVHKRIDDSFERLETRIAESNKTVHGRLDDLHTVLLHIASKSSFNADQD